MRRTLAAVAVAAVLLAGCGDDDSSSAPSTSSDVDAADAPATTTPPADLVFTGDPDSRFCELSRDAAEIPVRDPFAAGLEPDEVEVRFRALADRFHAFADAAPPPIEDDLALLVTTFDDFAEMLDAAGYDFARLAERDVDLSVFDTPELEGVAARLTAYQEQVCSAEVLNSR